MKNTYWFGITLLLLTLGCKDKTGEIDPITIEDKGPEGSSIPYFNINTSGRDIVDEPKVRANMSVFVNQQSEFSNFIGIELRGSTSRRLFDKKSFGIEFWDEAGEDVSLEILDFGKEEDWILYGPYSDKTLLRNVLIFDLSNDMGYWAPKTQIAELTINDVFRGVYIFMEKIKRDGDRLTIEPLDETMTSAEEITGGYILKIDKTSGGDNVVSGWDGDAIYEARNGFRSDYDIFGLPHGFQPYGPKQGDETYYLYEYPRADRITDQQKEYIEEYVKGFEDAILADDFSNDPRAYEEFIDISSFADFFILNELSANPDAYRLSTFLHKFRGQKLRMGPIWDFNIAFGNDARSASDVWIYEFNDREPNDLWLVPFWWDKLLSDSKFRRAVKQRWDELKSSILSSANINMKLDNWVDYMNENGAIDRNFEKWPVLGQALPFNSFVGATYEEEIGYLKNWISQRISWMDSQMSSW